MSIMCFARWSAVARSRRREGSFGSRVQPQRFVGGPEGIGPVIGGAEGE